MNVLPKIEDKKEQPDTVLFWVDDPNILLNSEYIFEFYPTQTMGFNQQLNALSRTIITITIVSFLFTRSLSLLIISFITLLAIYYLYKSQMEEPKKEGFTTPAKDFLTENVGVIPTDVFQDPSMQNPFSNVLVTDWVDNPQRKSAPPNSNPVIRDEILIKAKQMVENANSSQPDITDKLFKDVNEQLSFEQHLRQFNSNPVTTIPNNQSAFLDFCYGDLKSCKSGNLFACSKDISRYTNY